MPKPIEQLVFAFVENHEIIAFFFKFHRFTKNQLEPVDFSLKVSLKGIVINFVCVQFIFFYFL